MTSLDTPANQDTTLLTRAKETLAQADKLVKAADDLQNPLSNAIRLAEAGKPANLEVVLKKTEIHAGEVTRQVKKLITGDTKRAEVRPYTVPSLLNAYWGHVDNRREMMPTGFERLNEALGGGLEPQRLLVLLGAPGSGKTTLANHFAAHIADSGRPVVYATSEDSPLALLAKTISRRSGINYKAVLRGQADMKASIERALQDYSETTAAQRLLYVDATLSSELEEIRAHARAHFEQHKSAGQGVLVVDYLQRLARGQQAFRQGNMELRNAVTNMTEELSSIAKELDCCVIALAAMHRASGYGSASNALSAAKESGDIEYTADVMLAIVDDQQRDQTTSWLKPKLLRIDKNRQGESDMAIALDWYPARQQFTEANIDVTVEVTAPANGNGRKRGR